MDIVSRDTGFGIGRPAPYCIGWSAKQYVRFGIFEKILSGV